MWLGDGMEVMITRLFALCAPLFNMIKVLSQAVLLSGMLYLPYLPVSGFH